MRLQCKNIIFTRNAITITTTVDKNHHSYKSNGFCLSKKVISIMGYLIAASESTRHEQSHGGGGRRCGRVVGAPDLKSGGHRFKSRSDR